MGIYQSNNPSEEQPTEEVVMRTRMTPEEFESVREEFERDLAHLLSVLPKDVKVVGVERVEEN